MIINEFEFMLIMEFQWDSQEALPNTESAMWDRGRIRSRAFDVGIFSMWLVIDFMSLMDAKQAYE